MSGNVKYVYQTNRREVFFTGLICLLSWKLHSVLRNSFVRRPMALKATAGLATTNYKQIDTGNALSLGHAPQIIHEEKLGNVVDDIWRKQHARTQVFSRHTEHNLAQRWNVRFFREHREMSLSQHNLHSNPALHRKVYLKAPTLPLTLSCKKCMALKRPIIHPRKTLLACICSTPTPTSVV